MTLLPRPTITKLPYRLQYYFQQQPWFKYVCFWREGRACVKEGSCKCREKTHRDESDVVRKRKCGERRKKGKKEREEERERETKIENGTTFRPCLSSLPFLCERLHAHFASIPSLPPHLASSRRGRRVGLPSFRFLRERETKTGENVRCAREKAA